MSQEQHFIPFLKRMGHPAPSTAGVSDFCVPVHDAALYTTLLREASRLAIQQNEPNLLVIMDAETAAELPDGARIAEKAGQVVLFGDTFPLPWQHGPKVTTGPICSPMLPGDRILLLLSQSISLALFSHHPQMGQLTLDSSFQGAWTVQRTTATHLAHVLLDMHAITLPEDLWPCPQPEDRIAATAMRLTALHANAHLFREQHFASERNDLLSILDILKAISGQPNTHRILYVFVAQIADIIKTDRCSIVRIWPGDSLGYVEASHEDTQVCEKAIALEKYPEINEVLCTGEKVVIDDVATHPLTMDHAATLHAAGISALLVIPIALKNELLGTLLLRATRGSGPFSLREASFFEIVAEGAANALERIQMYNTIQHANEHLTKLATTDSLTGLFNRRYFFERFKDEYERAIRYSYALSCIIADVDNFKSINDVYGHLVGDAVLRQIAEQVDATTRSVDVVARYGGEEFAILMPNTEGLGAGKHAERLLETVAQQQFPDLPPHKRITISIGVASFDRATMKAPEDLLRAADAALYEAKGAGKNRVVTYQNKD